MPIISAPEDYMENDLFVDLRAAAGIPLHLKCEGLNFAGSIKLKAAVSMVDAAERAGRLTPDSVLVESSSGNLGVALSMIAAGRGYRFLCVTDARCNPSTRRRMEAFGARVHVVTEPEPAGGLLAARLALVRRLVAEDGRHVWLDQYTNSANQLAHARWTAPAIAARFPDLQVLFVGAGTAGTLMGCARWFKEHRPGVRIVAVDSVGSVIFGAAAGSRRIPGVGAAVRPALLDESYIDDVRWVSEPEAVLMCRRLAARGFLFGGSTGTVVAGASGWLAERAAAGERPVAAAVSADLGEAYLDTVYRDEWVLGTYGPDALPAAPGSGRPPKVLAEPA